MEPIKNFSLWKNTKPIEETKEGVKRHDYSLSAKIVNGNSDQFRDIGKGYINTTQDGSKQYIGLQLQSSYKTKDDTQVDGYVIVTEKQYSAMKQAWDDWQIKLKNPDYPTPTELGIQLPTADDLDSVDL